MKRFDLPPQSGALVAGGDDKDIMDADWTREQSTGGWNPSIALIRSIRGYQRNLQPGVIVGIRRRWNALMHRFWSAVSGADIPINTQLGGGLLMPHPNGIVMHPEAVVGVNCLIFQQVTLGAGSRPGFPRVGNHVDVGAGAKILGGITIGDHAKIGANAVVLSDIPAGATAVGSPARVVRQSSPEL